MITDQIIGILTSEGNGETKNIGDYIQSLAAKQFVPKDAKIVFLDREKLNSFKLDNRGKAKTIMNAWFMSKPANFPPSGSIKPLYVSFHLTPKVEDVFFSNKTIEHLKKYEPIGCRDANTVNLMLSHGIKAYFSGCLTLTLGLTYKNKKEENSPVYIVDPYCEKLFDLNILTTIIQLNRVLFYIIFKNRTIRNVSNQILKTTFKYKNRWKRFIYSAKIYSTYNSVIEDDVFLNAIYEEHRIPIDLIPTEEDRFEYAHCLLKKYENAKYVITSRIHCALPCLGMETPVLFTFSDNMERKFRPTRPTGRLEGLIDFFRCINIKRGKGKFEFDNKENRSICSNKLNMCSQFTNKDTWKKYMKNLKTECTLFINS